MLSAYLFFLQCRSCHKHLTNICSSSYFPNSILTVKTWYKTPAFIYYFTVWMICASDGLMVVHHFMSFSESCPKYYVSDFSFTCVWRGWVSIFSIKGCDVSVYFSDNKDSWKLFNKIIHLTCFKKRGENILFSKDQIMYWGLISGWCLNSTDLIYYTFVSLHYLHYPSSSFIRTPQEECCTRYLF